MQTQNKPFDFESLGSKLPVLGQFNSSEIQAGMNKLSTSQLTFYNTFRIIVFGAIGYGLWVYALPTFFVALGQIAGVVLGLITVILLFLARNSIFKILKNAARKIDKIAINQDPFMEFERQKKKMNENKVEFYQKSGIMVQLEQQMKNEAMSSEKAAKELQEKSQTLKSKVDVIREKLKSVQDKESDDYNSMLNLADKTYAEANGVMLRYNQAQTLTQKYGARAAVLNKLNRKLSRMSNAMDIKIMEFDNTVYLLQEDFKFAKNAAESTSAIKKTMLFDEPWELTYATDVVKSTIDSYISTTQMNMKDLDSITANYNIDDDSIFSKLESLSKRIESGEEQVVTAKIYNNPERTLTSEDKAASGGFGNIGF